MWVKVMLMIAATVLLLSVAATSDGPREYDIEKRKLTQSLANVIRMVQEMKKRLAKLESRRQILLRGRDGRDGPPGVPGPQGPSGVCNRNICKDGMPGPPGPRGLRGHTGKQGSRGPRGHTGRHGSRGPRGHMGRRGPRGLSGGGVEYIRWGKTTCPYGASMVYRGRIGGEWYNHYGGGANYVCLTENPKYSYRKPGVQTGAYMYGAEYRVFHKNPFLRNLNDHDAPCVACYVKTRRSKLMIPATYNCPAGWTREYHGYLMASDYEHKNNKAFICVDRYAEAVSGSKATRYGALMYNVEGRCGALPCLPYVEGLELTCAVCTK